MTGRDLSDKMPKKIAPLSICEPESKNYSKVFVEAAGATHIVCGVLAAVFNILFIYYGMASGWYYFKDSLGTEMRVISIGEGIIAGVFYMSFGSVFLYTLQSSGSSGGSSLLICSVMNILISLALILTPFDETQYWADLANSAKKKEERDKASAFWTALV